MKKLLVTIAALVVTLATTYGQGQLTFSNRATSQGLDAKAVFVNTTTGVEGPTYKAQLLLVGAGGATTALGTPSAFRTGTAAGYLSPVVVTVPGIDVGGSATVRMVVFTGDTFSGTELGRSSDVTVSLGGGTVTPPNLVGLKDVTGQQFIQVVPEPSTIALGLLGAAALLIRRRK